MQLIKSSVVILCRTNPESHLANSSKISISSFYTIFSLAERNNSHLFSLVTWDASFSEHPLKIRSITMITKTEVASLRRSIAPSLIQSVRACRSIRPLALHHGPEILGDSRFEYKHEI